MFLIVFIRTDFELHEAAGKIAGEITRWFGFGFFGKPDINGYEHTRLILAAVTWSLYFEWIFYFSLRVTYFFSGPKARLPFVLGGLGFSLLGTFFLRGGGITYTALFFAGMTAATLIHDGYKPKIDARLGALAALACPTLVFLCFPEVHNGFSVLLLAISFFIICLGNSIFGLLTCRGAQRLGHISYSVYLMQGIVLTLVYWNGAVKNFALSSDVNYWLTAFICGLLLTSGSAVLYGIVERPGIHLGRKLIARVRRK
jgi:peptidoglycan/LPS O-acetylase OafA/YrhL